MNSSPEIHENNVIIQSSSTIKAHNTYTLIHAVYALLAITLGSVWYHFILDPSRSLFGSYGSVGTFLFTLIFVAYTVTFFVLRDKKINKDAIIMLCALLVFSLRYAIYPHNDYSGISGYLYITLHFSAILSLRCIGNNNAFDTIVGDLGKAIFVSPFASFHTLFVALTAFFKIRRKPAGDKDKTEKIFMQAAFITLGIIISLPIMGAVLALLSSDGIFERFIGSVADFFSDIDISFNIGRYINVITVLVSLYIYGALYSADKDSTIKERTNSSYEIFPFTVSKTVFIVLLIVYSIFFIAQIDGFGHMLLGKLPEGMTYSTFARSGFFELCAVACINGAVLFYSEIFTVDGKKKRLLKYLMISFTLFLIATAATKMIMYITAFGFTEKRFYCLWLMILLTVLFILAITKVKNNTFKLSRTSVYITLSWLIVLFLVDFDALSTLLNNSIGIW